MVKLLFDLAIRDFLSMDSVLMSILESANLEKSRSLLWTSSFSYFSSFGSFCFE